MMKTALRTVNHHISCVKSAAVYVGTSRDQAIGSPPPLALKVTEEMKFSMTADDRSLGAPGTQTTLVGKISKLQEA